MDRDEAERAEGGVPTPLASAGGNGEQARKRWQEDPRGDDEAGGSRPTEDEELLNRPTPHLPRARAPEMAAFTHSDPWRVLRIQGEFVHGINALAEVGAAVAVFGSARFAADHPMYSQAESMGRALAGAGFAVITGGGPGLMEAANKGAYQAGGFSIGCNIELPF